MKNSKKRGDEAKGCFQKALEFDPTLWQVRLELSGLANSKMWKATMFCGLLLWEMRYR
jgi:hypothetical protein